MPLPRHEKLVFGMLPLETPAEGCCKMWERNKKIKLNYLKLHRNVDQTQQCVKTRGFWNSRGSRVHWIGNANKSRSPSIFAQYLTSAIRDLRSRNPIFDVEQNKHKSRRKSVAPDARWVSRRGEIDEFACVHFLCHCYTQRKPVSSTTLLSDLTRSRNWAEKKK